jgi:hypothetical protein
MSTRMPTRRRAAAVYHPAYATLCLASAPHNLEVCCNHPLHTTSAPPDELAQVTAIRFRAQSAASTPRKRHSIPIHRPR